MAMSYGPASRIRLEVRLRLKQVTALCGDREPHGWRPSRATSAKPEDTSQGSASSEYVVNTPALVCQPSGSEPAEAWRAFWAQALDRDLRSMISDGSVLSSARPGPRCVSLASCVDDLAGSARARRNNKQAPSARCHPGSRAARRAGIPVPSATAYNALQARLSWLQQPLGLSRR